MQASEFNKKYPIGKCFIYQPCPMLRGGRTVKTVDIARDQETSTVVEINVEPHFVNIKSLKPAG